MSIAPVRRLVLLALGALLALTLPIGTGATSLPNDDPGSPVGLSTLAMSYQLVDSVLNDGDAEAAADLIAADATIQTNYGTFTGPQGLLDYASRVRETYPDATFAVTSMTTSGDTLEISWTMTASQILRGQQTFDFDIVLDGTSTVTVDDRQITGVTQETEIVSGGAARDSATVPQTGIPY